MDSSFSDNWIPTNLSNDKCWLTIFWNECSIFVSYGDRQSIGETNLFEKMLWSRTTYFGHIHSDYCITIY